ncbi:MAG: IS630 family transposase, partial [Clostridiales Family XIII bacterium]|nr:IS630 family transposase [Clostridiales Family XIII bacterium]
MTAACEHRCYDRSENDGGHTKIAFVSIIVLDVYEMPYDPARPVVCMNEKPYQLLGEAREPLPMRPGSNLKTDSEYVREGTCSIFAFTEPLGGNRHVSVREHRTAIDWAEEVKNLTDVCYPDVEKIILVMDNLNTHVIASLYKAFPPEEARRIARRLETHYTPKHGSWLNMCEIELNVMTRQCLSRRI